MRLRPTWPWYVSLGAIALVGGALLRSGLDPAVSEGPTGRTDPSEPELGALLTCVLPDPSPPGAAAVRPPVTVRVLDAGRGTALAGVRVEVTGLIAPEGVEPEALFARETDGSGSAHFRDLPPGRATVRAVSPGAAPGETGSTRAIKALHAELMALTSAEESNEPAAARPPEPWPGSRLAGVIASAGLEGPVVSLAIPAMLPFDVDVVSGVDGRSHPGARWRARNRIAWAAEAGSPMLVAVAPSKDLLLELEVVAPPGHVAYDDRSWSVRIHPAARRLRAVYPLRETALVEVVLPESGPGAGRVDGRVAIRVADVHVVASLEEAASGRQRLEGCPHLPGDLVVLSGWIGEDWLLEASLALPEAFSTPVVIRPDVRTAPPVPPEQRELRAIVAILPDGVISMGPGSAWRHDNWCFLQYRFRSETPEEHATAPVAVVDEPGAVGAMVHVVVLDASDRAVPFATLKVGLGDGLGWTDFDADGTQRVDPFTNVDGRRTLGLDPGRATIQAACGTRASRAHVVLQAGEERTLTLRLPSVLPASPRDVPRAEKR